MDYLWLKKILRYIVCAESVPGPLVFGSDESSSCRSNLVRGNQRHLERHSRHHGGRYHWTGKRLNSLKNRNKKLLKYEKVLFSSHDMTSIFLWVDLRAYVDRIWGSLIKRKLIRFFFRIGNKISKRYKFEVYYVDYSIIHSRECRRLIRGMLEAHKTWQKAKDQAMQRWGQRFLLQVGEHEFWFKKVDNFMSLWDFLKFILRNWKKKLTNNLEFVLNTKWRNVYENETSSWIAVIFERNLKK